MTFHKPIIPKRYFFLLGHLLITTVLFAQNKTNIKGKVVDSASLQPMELATIAIVNVKDSSLIAYTNTRKSGEFTLLGMPVDRSLRIVVSFVGYKSCSKIIHLSKGTNVSLGIIKLSDNRTFLNEVKITGDAPPVIIKKDTIEFNAIAFKTPPNAVVEELLRRLPGIQVNMDGTITYNGKTVNKLLIDGREFFANDPKIASRNLDAVLIDKVQVYDDRENDPDHLIPDSKVSKIINLKFKSKLRKSTFGKVKAGAGTRNRYDAGILYNMFRDTLQFSIIGIGNNLNRTGFSNQDLISQGGFNRSGGEALYNGSLATGGKGYGGIQTVGSGGVNINNNYGKRLKINLLYFYGYTNDIYKTKVSSQTFLKDTSLTNNGENETHNANKKSNISGLVEWKKDTTIALNYRPSLVISNSYSNNTGNTETYNNSLSLINKVLYTNFSSPNSVKFQHNFSYYHKFHGKDNSLNISHFLNISPSSNLSYNNNVLTSYSSLLSSSSLHRLSDNNNSNVYSSINVTYRVPLSRKLTGSIDISNYYNANHGQLFVYDENLQTGAYNVYIDSLSNNLLRRQFTESLQPALTYKFSKNAKMVIGTQLQLMQTDNHFNKNLPDINRRELFLLPNFHFDGPTISFNYNTYVNQPSINSLLPQTVVYSQLYSTTGNPDLKASRVHDFNLNYYLYKSERQFNISVYANSSITENDIINKKSINSVGATLTKPINKNGRYSLNSGVYLGKGYKKTGKWQVRLGTSLNANYNHNFFEVNMEEGFQNTIYIGLSQQFQLNWDNKVDINPSFSISPNITTYQNINYEPVRYVSRNIDVPMSVRWPKHTLIDISYKYTYNPLVSPGFQRSMNLLNMAVARQIQKGDKGEIRISCYDLFDQNISTFRSPNANTVSDYQFQILKRYFLLSYAYRFSSTKTK